MRKYCRGELSLQGINASLASYSGHLSHTNSNKIKDRIEKFHFMVAADNEIDLAAQCNAAGIGTMPAVPDCFPRA